MKKTKKSQRPLTELRIRPFDFAVDYGSYHYWFQKHGWNSSPVREILSDTGLMVVDGYGERKAACFVYYTNSKVVLMEWMVTNPALAPREAIKCIDMLVNHIKLAMIKSRKLRFLMGVTDHPKLRRHYQKHHDALTDQQCWVVMWDRDRGRYNKNGT